MPDWPLIGREAELTTLRELLSTPRPPGIVLAGPAGVGKTRLGRECLRIAAEAGLDTAQVTATRSAARLPFGAVAPLLHAAAPAPGVVDDRLDVLRRSVAALSERAGDRELLLFVDDAHLLDDASATLVHQVAATGAATVLATVTAGEPAPDAVVALWKDGLAARVEIGGLAAEAIEQLLAAALGGPVDPATALDLAERCQGNALFLRELVVGALDDGSLRDEGGLWRLAGEPAPSARLVEIVEARLGRLAEGERALMELVAYGEPLGQAALATLSDPGIAAGLERRDLLASHVGDRGVEVWLSHPMYGEVLRARTPAVRARTIAESLADAVEHAGGLRDEDVLRVATWRQLAGGGRAAVLVEGATIARWRYDFPLAERLARAAADRGAGFDAALLAAQVTGLQGRRDDAEAELSELAAQAADDGQRAAVAAARFDNGAGPTARARAALLDEGEAAVRDPRARDLLRARRLAVVLDVEGPRAAARAAEQLARRAGGEALAVTCVVGAYSLARLGRLDDACALSERGRAARRDVDSPLAWYPWWHAATRAVALRHSGRLAEADAIVAAHHREALAEGSAEAQAAFAALDADAVGERGRVATAARRAREALAVDQRLGRPERVRHDRAAGALALALAGRADEAAAELEALDDLGLGPLMRDEVDVRQARAWTAAAAGDLSRARAHVERAAALGEEIGDLVGAAAALHGLARLGAPREALDRLAAVADRVDGDLAPARVAHVDALVQGDATGLVKASHDFEAMGADLLAAEAAADAAVALRRTGELREAAAASRRAGDLAARAEDPVTPALHAIDARTRLTPAERETAALAAAGRTNREIADQLHLSGRTVENRLQRVYEKLGVSGRTELAGVLRSDV
ncbi:MAG TPA: AAA family ATPase [Acidimicrobiales bacterium]